VTPKGTPLKWLPVPNAIDVIEDPRASADIASRYSQGHPLVGHFGTFGALITPLLTATVLPLIADSDCRVLLIGRGSREVCEQLSSLHPELVGRLHATGTLAADDVSRHIRACTVMMQPYPDGISSRRTSAMAPLAHGVPIVTTEGPLSESVWREAGAVVLVPAGEAATLADAVASLAADPTRQRDLSRKSRELYESKFHIRHTIAALRA